ncbi:hypothetical protein G6M89_08705 [Natronolimnobius sp. AArcel1]|uniref:TolB family protein n=1 Tax=Natronolimnobius sp. AArcel1 TaxID=1679093 RepID=UPI0013ECE517|nr:hypothetical protein [Natronolimnobius sp. AArcel1]NGM69086.1 hypothetical protein [Natronolimnobius sp. AArcel1]
MSYNPLERRVAELLNRFPALKRTTKAAYQRTNYLLFGDRKFTHTLHPAVEIETPAECMDTQSLEGAELFGYFDTSPWNQSMDAMVYHRPLDDSQAAIQCYQEQTTDTIATTTAWNYQQGARTQWHPTNDDHILYNDCREATLVTAVVDTSGSEVKHFEYPLQAMSPTGDAFISLNYHRLDYNRPDYGYGLDTPSKIHDPSEDGLWRVETDTGSSELCIQLAELIDNDVAQQNHYLNHVLYNPSGDRFVFLHRWNGPEGRVSRLYVADQEGEYQLIMDDGLVSHYCWIDETRLFVWGRTEAFGDGYHIVDVETGDTEYVDALDGYSDGHPSLSPNGQWIVTDTYPDRGRRRHLLLYNLEQETVVEIGQFLAPFEYEGQHRCDLHPRWSPDGTAISIDSAHEGVRRSYILDVSALGSDSSRSNA